MGRLKVVLLILMSVLIYPPRLGIQIRKLVSLMRWATSSSSARSVDTPPQNCSTSGLS